jgi:two-component system nitrogen regulation response regulator GlnG
MIAATNKRLEAMVEEKTFREDLYYRLNVVRIKLPPLRERSEDVPQLIDFVLKRLALESKANAKSISPEALALLSKYNWPGNVRELENLVYRSAVMAPGETILIKDLPQEIVQAVAKPSSEAIEVPSEASADGALPEPVEDTRNVLTASAPDEPVLDTEMLGGPIEDPFKTVYTLLRQRSDRNLLENMEKEMIAHTLEETNGKQVKAAEILGITRATLRKRIDQYALR